MVSNVVGSLSLGAFSSVVVCSILQSFSNVLPLLLSLASPPLSLFQGRLSWERGCVPPLLCCRTLSHSRSITRRLGEIEKCIWTRIFLPILWKL
jgi:hypothetical protein